MRLNSSPVRGMFHGIIPSWLGCQILLRCLSVGLLALVCPPGGKACVYGPEGFEVSEKCQTTPFALLNEQYREEWTRKGEYYQKKLETLERKRKESGGDAGLDLAVTWALFRSGKMAEAESRWKAQLSKNPEDYAALANYATALHLSNRLAEAEGLLRKLEKIRPGVRGGAELLHLRMVESQMRVRNSQPGKSLLFLPELESAWNGRNPGDFGFRNQVFKELNSGAAAELCRQFPEFGDGWLALGVALEREGDMYLALRAYQRAVKRNSTRRKEVEAYLEVFTPHASRYDPVRSGSRGILSILVLVVGGGLVYGGLRFIQNVQQDIRSARDLKEQEKGKKRSSR